MYFFYYYPVGVDVPSARRPVMTWALLLGLTVIFVLSVPLRSTNDVSWWAWTYRPATAGLLTPLTACFLHAGWMHLLGNLIYLWVFGPALERALGSVGLFGLFCTCGYLGNLMQGALVMRWAPAAAHGGVVGASGALSGLLGLFLLRYYFARIKLAWWAFLPLQGINRTGTTYVPAAVGVLLWVGLQIALALGSGGGGGTAYGAHLGGLLTGLLLAISLGLSRKGRVEHVLAQARHAREVGNLHDAVGLLQRYLRDVPDDEESQLDLARLLCIQGDRGEAQRMFRDLVAQRMRRSDMAGACEVFIEARRANAAFILSPRRQRRVAFWLEKSTQFAWAATAYLDYARFYGGREGADHAMARAATLLLTRVGNRDEGLAALERAIDEHPRSPWRHMLEQERARLGGSLSG